MAIIDKIDKLSGTDTRSRNITQAIDKYSGKGPSKNIDDAVKKLDETGTLGKMGIKERIDHLSNAQTMSRDITQAIDRHTGKGPSKNIEEALKWWEDPTPPGPGITEAYAVFDSADGSLVFFRDEPGKYSEGQVADTKTYYTGVETKTSGFGWTDYPGFPITNVRFDDEIEPVSTSNWFSWRDNLTSIIGLDKLNTSNVTDMNNMFNNCSALTSIDVSGFDTSNVTDMNYMFNNCDSLTSIDVSGFNTSNVAGMQGMFDACGALTSIDVSSFNTSNVTDMSYMFSSCGALTSIDVSGFNTSNVTDMGYMFGSCGALTSIDVSSFNTSNVTDMSYMFNNCDSLTSIDVSGFNTSNVAGMQGMFNGCADLTSIDVSRFDTSNVTDMQGMFNYCTELTFIDVSGFDISKVTNMIDMFQGCRSLTTDITINDISKYSASMFVNAATFPSALITLYGEGSVTSNDIDTFIDSVMADSPESNIVNGMAPAQDVVADTDIYFENTDLDTQEFPQLLTVSLNSKVNIDISNYEEYNFDTNEWEELAVNLVPQPLTIDNSYVQFMTAPVPISGWESYDRQFTLRLYDADTVSASSGKGVVSEAHYSEIGPARLRFHMKITKVE